MLTAAEIRPNDRFAWLGEVYEVRTVAQGSVVLVHASNPRVGTKHLTVRTLLENGSYLGRAPVVEA